MELSPTELSAASEEFQRLAPRAAPLAIDRRLPPAALAGYRALEASGSAFPADALDDWAVMVLMGQRVARNAALSPVNGVEAVLMQHSVDGAQTIAGLETAQSTLVVYDKSDSLSPREGGRAVTPDGGSMV